MRLQSLVSLLVRRLLLAMAVFSVVAAQAEDWKTVTSKDGVDIYQRSHGDSDLLEFKGTGVIDAPPAQVKKVLDDVTAYPDFMPFVKEAKVLSNDGKTRISYQRISPPAISDRDYTLRVRSETRTCAQGQGFLTSWEPANDRGPGEISGVVRVQKTEGSWLLEPLEQGRKTQATYVVFTDCGGSLPSFVLNSAGQSGVSRVFVALRKQVRLPKYAGK